MPAATVWGHFVAQVEEQREWNEPAEKDEPQGDHEEATVNRMGVYKEILEILQPGETVLKVRLSAPLSPSPFSLLLSLFPLDHCLRVL